MHMILLTCFLLVGATARDSPVSDAIEQVRASIARIEVTVTYKLEQPPILKSMTFYGTGFILDEQGHIATADHVVNIGILEDQVRDILHTQRLHVVPKSLAISAIDVSFPARNVEHDSNNNQFYDISKHFRANVFKEDGGADIAILVCNTNPLSSGPIMVVGSEKQRIRMPKIQHTPPKDGDMISVSGFPFNILALVTNTGWVATHFYKDELDRSVYLGDIQVNHGNSGGPVYEDLDGSIIGIAVEYRVTPEGFNSKLAVIVPIRRALDLVSTNDTVK